MCAIGSILEPLPETCSEGCGFLLHSILKIEKKYCILAYHVQFFCSMARCDPALCRHCWLRFFLCLLRAWLSTFIFTSQLLFFPFFFFLCAYPVMQVHHLRGWCPRSASGSGGWTCQGWMVLCWLMCSAPLGPQWLSLVWKENICLWFVWTDVHENHQKLSVKTHTRAPTWLQVGYVICWYILPLYQLPVQVDDLSQAVIGL